MTNFQLIDWASQLTLWAVHKYSPSIQTWKFGQKAILPVLKFGITDSGKLGTHWGLSKAKRSGFSEARPEQYFYKSATGSPLQLVFTLNVN